LIAVDDISCQHDYYRFTPNLDNIWKLKNPVVTEQTKLL